MVKFLKTAAFKFMCLCFNVRDRLAPPVGILNEAGVAPGQSVVDFGCGPGSYSTAAAEIVGPLGKVYAMDVNPLAVSRVRRIASETGLTNIEAVLTDCETGLADNSIDVVLMYDVFHELSERDRVLEEVHRILKSGGVLSFSDHHMKGRDILRSVTDRGLFEPGPKVGKAYRFRKPASRA